MKNFHTNKRIRKIHLPCETRCYKIAKADVAAYLRRRLAEPAYYTSPSGWYENLLARQPDVLDTHQIARFTGYTPHTVSRWCTEGRLRTIQRRPRFMVPKTWLLDYLVSDDYNKITRKSKTHYSMITTLGTKLSQLEKKG